MPENEYPGVYLEEGASPKPIDGVPTANGDALTPADRRRWLIWLVIGVIVLTGLGFWFAA